MLAAIGGIIYGLANLGSLELKALHERQPLFVMQSDGSIQNKYVLKVLNKTDSDMQVMLTVSGHDELKLVNAGKLLTARQGRVTPHTIFLRIPGDKLNAERIPVILRVENVEHTELFAEYQSMFFGPAK